jgi:hypothetical protein
LAAQAAAGCESRPKRAAKGAGVLVEDGVLDAQGQPVAGLLLFPSDGQLNGVEVWSAGKPLDLPLVDWARLMPAVK